MSGAMSRQWPAMLGWAAVPAWAILRLGCYTVAMVLLTAMHGALTLTGHVVRGVVGLLLAGACIVGVVAFWVWLLLTIAGAVHP